MRLTKNQASNLEVKLCAFHNAFNWQTTLRLLWWHHTEKIRAFMNKVPEFFRANIMVLLRRARYHSIKTIIQSKIIEVSFQCANVSYFGTCLGRLYKSTFSNLACCTREEAERKKNMEISNLKRPCLSPVITDFASFFLSKISMINYLHWWETFAVGSQHLRRDHKKKR